MSLKEKVVVVVGGTSGIGLAAARLFAQAGAQLVIAGRDAERGARSLEILREISDSVAFRQVDVTDCASVSALFAQIEQQFNRLDCAFNNAGWESVPARCADIEEEDWDRMLDIKLKGVWQCMKHELAMMLSGGGGSIVNMAGNWGLQAAPMFGAYAAAAHGVMGLTRTAATEYAADNIRVNAVCPGAVDTPLLDRMVGGDQAFKAQLGEQLAVGRIAQPEEVAQAVLWLSSAESSYISGEGLALTGGGARN